MTRTELLQNKAAAWTFAMDWAKEGAVGARTLKKIAAEIRSEYSTNGLWNPDAELVYLYFMEAAEMAVSDCDCQNPQPNSDVAHISEQCPLHNLHPATA